MELLISEGGFTKTEENDLELDLYSEVGRILLQCDEVRLHLPPLADSFFAPPEGPFAIVDNQFESSILYDALDMRFQSANMPLNLDPRAWSSIPRCFGLLFYV